MNFQTIWIPKGILAKILSEKKLLLGNISYLKYALNKKKDDVPLTHMTRAYLR